MPDSRSTAWQVFTTSPRREGLVCELMQSIGIPSMAPHTRAFDRVSRSRIVSWIEPVFPRYVFAQIEAGRWGELGRVPFLSPRPICMGGKPYQLSVSDWMTVNEMCVNPVRSPNEPQVRRAVVPGCKAKVIEGHLEGRWVKVLSVTGKRAKALYFDKVLDLPLTSLEAA